MILRKNVSKEKSLGLKKVTQLKNLLVGNGINCQFDYTSYTSKQIVLRILKNCSRLDFPSDIIVDFPILLKDYLGMLFLNARKVITGDFDVFALSSAEKESIYAFRDQYSKMDPRKWTPQF